MHCWPLLTAIPVGVHIVQCTDGNMGNGIGQPNVDVDVKQVSQYPRRQLFADCLLKYMASD